MWIPVEEDLPSRLPPLHHQQDDASSDESKPNDHALVMEVSMEMAFISTGGSQSVWEVKYWMGLFGTDSLMGLCTTNQW